jgi:DNA/RNA-binding domain of Phe-tRNA-synthetase-like protein
MELVMIKEAKDAYPVLKASILKVSLHGKPSLNEELMLLKQELETRIREEYKSPESMDRVLKYNSFYKRFSSKVPMEFQIRSILDGKEIPTFNPMITCMFMAELKNIVLTAGHDSAHLGKKIEVHLANGTEEYVKINGKAQTLKKGDIYATDGKSIISSVLYGPDQRARITPDTRECLFMCYGFGLTGEDLERHMKDLSSYLHVLGRDVVAGSIKVI